MIRNCIKLCHKNGLTHLIRNLREPVERSMYFRPVSPPSFAIQNIRFKSKTSRKKEASESESDSYENRTLHEAEDKYTKVININVTSLRLDAILKSSLGVARNKIETMFYESKIRLNGEKIQKKSASIQEGDEIDLIKGPDVKNPNFINVARVEILSIKSKEDSISIKIKRCKSLTIDSYT